MPTDTIQVATFLAGGVQVHMIRETSTEESEAEARFTGEWDTTYYAVDAFGATSHYETFEEGMAYAMVTAGFGPGLRGIVVCAEDMP